MTTRVLLLASWFVRMELPMPNQASLRVYPTAPPQTSGKLAEVINYVLYILHSILF